MSAKNWLRWRVIKGRRYRLIFPLLGGALVTGLLYAGAVWHRDLERSLVARHQLETIATTLLSRFQTLEQRIEALRLLWSASHSVEESEWELACQQLQLRLWKEWQAAGIVQFPIVLRDTGSSSPAASVPSRVLHMAVRGDAAREEPFYETMLLGLQYLSRDLVKQDRFTIPLGRFLIFGQRAIRVHDDPTVFDLYTTWAVGVIDAEEALSEVLASGPFAGQLRLRNCRSGVSWEVRAGQARPTSSHSHPAAVSQVLPWTAEPFELAFHPQHVFGDLLHESLPYLALGIGGLFTVLLGVLGSVAEHTGRRLAAVRQRFSGLLDKSEQRYRTVFNSVHQPLLIATDQLCIGEMNPAAMAFLGPDMAGRRLCDLCPRKDGCGVGSQRVCWWFAGRPSAEDASWITEGEIVLPDGRKRQVVARISEVSLGQEQRWLIALHDVTEQREVQRRLEENAQVLEAANVRLRLYSQEIENAARQKITWLASMSHEIRTPLSAILGYTRLLSEELTSCGLMGDAGAMGPSLPGEEFALPAQAPWPTRLAARSQWLQETLDGLVRNSEHLLEMVSSILDFSKIEAGRMELERIDTNPVAVAADVLRMLSVKARQKGLVLELKVSGQVPAVIQTDPTRLRQILLNLTDNAIKFTPQGRVWIDVELDRQTPGGAVIEYRVCDTGVGMSPDQIARLFQPFRQSDVTTYRQFGGTGLGLMISRQLARLLGGDIWVESQPGRGSIFHVRIGCGALDESRLVDGEVLLRQTERGEKPSYSEAKSHGSAERPAASDPARVRLKGRVLLAEDFPDNQRLIRHYLERAGLTVESVENGQEALESYQRAVQRQMPFDLVVMDIEMPEMDGVTAVRKMRDLGCTIPVVALTAHTDPSCVAQFLEAGFSAYVAKPIRRETLLETLGRLLGRPGPSGDEPTPLTGDDLTVTEIPRQPAPSTASPS